MPANGQSVLSGWTDGPLPIQWLEQAACELFADAHPMGLWGEPNYSAERNACRRQVVRMYARFLTAERWTLSNMHDRLTAGFSGVLFGDRAPSVAERRRVEDFAEKCLADLFPAFSSSTNPIALPVAWSVPSGQGINDEWRNAFAATKFAEVLADLAVPGLPLREFDPKDRAWMREQAETLVDDTVARFTSHPGDVEYQPQEEPEYDFDGLTADEAAR